MHFIGWVLPCAKIMATTGILGSHFAFHSAASPIDGLRVTDALYVYQTLVKQ